MRVKKSWVSSKTAGGFLRAAEKQAIDLPMATHFSCASYSQMLVVFSATYISKQNLASAS